jgi:tRNA 2-selenouridine synthase
MMINTIEIEQFLELSKKYPVFDVRAPQEYAQGHIPNAYSLPLFTDGERALIGTLYKQQGKQIAMQKALELVGPTLSILVQHVAQETPGKTILVHCWRGGMRSASVGWLLSLFGYTVYALKGGYKQFRARMRATFEQPYVLRVIGGKTGTGKTKLLQKLAHDHQVIDLEALACHRGSVFGALAIKQPTQEQFENELGYQLYACDAQKQLFLEDESRAIGAIAIPVAFFAQLRAAPREIIEQSFDQRLEHILQEYAALTPEHFYAGVKRLERHLGGARAQEICALYGADDVRAACAKLMQYYDKTYEYSERKRGI